MFANCKNCEDGVIFDYETEAGETILRCTNFPQCRTMEIIAPTHGDDNQAVGEHKAISERVTF